MEKAMNYQYQNIYNDLLRLIGSGEIQPGGKLPTEAELAARYSVSRITSKKALNMLAERGLVSRRSGKGTYLNPGVSSMIEPEIRSSGNRLLGLVADNLLQSFGLNLFYELDRVAHEAGFRLYLRNTDCSQLREAEEINYLRSIGAEGIFVIPTRAQYYNKAILRLVLEHYPVYILDSALSGIQVPFVSTDNLSSGSMLTDHLYELGHKHIALATVDMKTAVSLEDRHEGYAKALERRGIPYRREYVIDELKSSLTEMDRKAAAAFDLEHLTDFFTRNPQVTGVVVLQYALASLVRRAAEAAGRIVPDTLSIAVFDEIYDASGYYVYTHIKQDEARIAREAMGRMIDSLNGRPVEMESYIQARMKHGQTTAPAPGQKQASEKACI